MKSSDLASAIKDVDMGIDADISDFYANKVKSLYGEIIHYATLSQESMNEEEQNRVYALKLASREIIEAMKNMRDLQRNISYYSKSKNTI